MSSISILQPIKKVRGIIHLPGSKSISNRALLMAAQAEGRTKLINLLDSEDTRYMLHALKKLGVLYNISPDRRICEIEGLGGPLQVNSSNIILFVGNAGTVMRSLTAALSLQSRGIILTGGSRMKERPIGDLVDALHQGKGNIKYLENYNYPPLYISGGFVGGNITIYGNISSQFISSILMMAPLASQDSCIKIKGSLVSKPYIDMTISMMQIFGIKIYNDNYCTFYIKGKNCYKSPGNYLIEGDASSASYFLAAAAINGDYIKVIGVGEHSLQGDIEFANVLKMMGAHILWGDDYIKCIRGTLRSIDIDVNHIPDAAMTIAIIGLFIQQGIMTLRNIYNWRVKESDRLYAMANELRKTGALVIEGHDFLSIKSPIRIRKTQIYSYDDHRIAMCFALLALSGNSVTIINSNCVSKTFPNFFQKFRDISILK